MKKQPVLVHFLFHPESESARSLARHVHLELNGDLIVPGLRIPTIFSPRSDPGEKPEPLRFDFSERNLVVVLADNQMVVDDVWSRFAADTWEQCKDSSVRFVPFQLSSAAFPLDERLDKLSFGRALAYPEEGARRAHIVRRIVIALYRYLLDLDRALDRELEAPITVFLSHAKADIEKQPLVTAKLIDCLKADQPIKAWVDSGGIAEGADFAEEIETAIKGNSVLAVLTDAYATREWCREEIFLAKEHQRPIAVIDALTDFEVRSFPYVGNVPRIRWDGDPQKGIDLLLKESLRHLHAITVLGQSSRPDDVVSARPPELATLVGVEPGSTVLYPDPPVGVGEAKRLAKARFAITTPLQRLAEDRSLKGKRIALSMSESNDIDRCGMDLLHLEAGMLELSRYLLIRGATLAYGGHLGKPGYTEKLFELVRSNNLIKGSTPYQPIVNHVGWPLPRPDTDKRAEIKTIGVTIPLPRPAGINETLHADFAESPAFFPAEKSALHRFAWARGMTEMRAFQADRSRSGVVARVALGGPFGSTIGVAPDGTKTKKWYMSRIPGVLEEIFLSVQAGQPVFLIGAFGGATKMVIDLIHGVDRPEASWEYQKDAPFASEMRKLYEERGLAWADYPDIVSFLRQEGRQYINPFLDESEREELFETVDVTRMIELVLRGLSQV